MSVSGLIFLVIFLSLGVLAMSKDPVYGLGNYILLYFFSGQWWWQDLPHLPFSKIAILFTLVGFFATKRSLNISTLDFPPTKWIFSLALLALLMLPFAVSTYYHKFYLVILWKNILVFWLIIKIVDKPEKLKKLSYFFLAGAFYLSFTAWQMGRTSGGRLEGIGVADGGDANLCAAALVVAVPIALSLLFNAKMKEKMFLGVSLVFILNALILYNSRGAFLALVAAGIVLVFNFLRVGLTGGGIKIKLVVAAGLAVCAFFYLADQTFWDRMRTLEDTSAEGSGARTLIWKSSADFIQDYPFGTGAEGFTLLSPQYIPSEMVEQKTGTRAMHNTYLQALTDYGVFGFLIFIFMLGSVFRYVARAKKQIKAKAESFMPTLLGLEAGLVAHLVAAIFINRLYSEVLYWLPAMIAVAGNPRVLGFEHEKN